MCGDAEMTNEQETKNLLQDHEKRIAALEKIFHNKPAQMTNAGRQKTLSDHIIELRADGFFAQPQTALEVHTKLQPSYPCEQKRVGVALIRLADQKQLRKASKTIDQKRYIAYVW
jgi:hypothetical protein